MGLEVGDGSWEEEEEGGDRIPIAPDIVSAEVRFLRQDSGGFWELGPLPDQGTVLRVELAKAMSSFMTEKWSKFDKLVKVIR